jgi:hypothetical protein
VSTTASMSTAAFVSPEAIQQARTIAWTTALGAAITPKERYSDPLGASHSLSNTKCVFSARMS